jgi:putative ABC transport system permease protein
MFIISSLLFNAGLLVLINFGGYFDKTIEELNTSDTYYLIANNLYDQELEDYIFNHDNLIEAEIEDSLWGVALTYTEDEEIGTSFVISNADILKKLSRWKRVGEFSPLEDMSIYLPISFNLSNGFEKGDDFILEIDDTRSLSFKIAGFTEDIFFNSRESGLPGFYVNTATYNKVESILGNDAKVKKVFANLKELNKDIEIGIKEMTGAETITISVQFTNGMLSLDKTIVKAARVMMATMMSLIFVVFSSIIVIVCLLVVRFRIGNTIEDDMMKIGSLKALGYTSKQIILSIVLQFLLIAAFGSFIGIGLSYTTLPTLSDIFSRQSALIWKQGFDLGISLFTLLFIIAVVVLVSLITARRIHKLNPIIALRGGIVTHNFRKNHLPLEKSKVNLTFLLAMKTIFNNLKQSFLILVISIAVSFAGAFAVVMYYNTNVDIKAFKETPGTELSSIIAVLNPEVDSMEFLDKISNLDTVRKAQYIDTVTTYVDGIEIYINVMDDYSKKESDTIYKGRYPIHSNEVAINGYLAGLISKEIGDSIDVKLGEAYETFLITGLTQGSNMMGMTSFITTVGIKKLNPDFKQANLQIYLDKGTSSEEFVIMLEESYGDETLVFLDFDLEMKLGTRSYVDIVSQVGIAILFITTIIIILVLYFVINSSVVRNKKQLGIQKAVGFTTYQLMNQLSLSFLLPIIVGVVLGSTLGNDLTNPILTFVQSSMGIMKTNYIITPLWTAVFGIAIILISYITSLSITYRIRKITTYALITE